MKCISTDMDYRDFTDGGKRNRPYSPGIFIVEVNFGDLNAFRLVLIRKITEFTIFAMIFISEELILAAIAADPTAGVALKFQHNL